MVSSIVGSIVGFVVGRAEGSYVGDGTLPLGREQVLFFVVGHLETHWRTSASMKSFRLIEHVE